MWQYFRFQDPWLLLGLLFIPMLFIFGLKKKHAVIRFSSIQTLKHLNAHRSGFLKAAPVILRCLVILALVLALARPQEGRKTREVQSSGVDIMLAIDTSGSMRALDFTREDNRINRLEAVKDVVNEFVRNRKNDRLGIVAFGAEAFTQCPLTLDHDVLQMFLEKMKIGMAGDRTAIGSAIGIAVKRLKDLKAESKVIILLTDGQNNAGMVSPLQAAEIAKTFEIKIYTIGAGNHGRAPFLVNTPFGKRYIYQDVTIDENTLKEISSITGAQYFRATDTQSLTDIYQEINQLEKTEVKVREHTDYTELFPWFLMVGLGFLLLEIISVQTRLQRIP